MRKFIVGLFYEESGHVTIEANTAFEAEEEIEKELEQNGIDKLAIRTTDRAYGVTDVRSLNENLFKRKEPPD